MNNRWQQKNTQQPLDVPHRTAERTLNADCAEAFRMLPLETEPPSWLIKTGSIR